MQPYASKPLEASAPKPSTTPQAPPAGFYKTYGRPFTKVFFGAVFVYQAVYWLWVKFEVEEIKDKKQSKIKDLENEIRAFDKRRQPEA